MAMLAWLPSRPTAVSVHSPLTVSRPRTVSPRSVKKAIVASRSRTAIPTFSSLMGMRCTLSSQDDTSPAAEWTDAVRARPVPLLLLSSPDVVVALAVGHDAGCVVLGPDPDRLDGREEVATEVGQVVLDAGRDLGEDRPGHDAIALEGAQ